MLTRRTLLKTTAAVTAVTVAGMDVALAAPEGKLVGEGFFCLKCIANGNVAIADVERVTIGDQAFLRLQTMDIDVGEIERYLARGIYTPENKENYYKRNRMELLHAAKALNDAQKLDVRDGAHSEEPDAPMWTRNGVPYDSGTEMERDDYFRFGHLVSAGSYKRDATDYYIVASVIE